MYLNKFVQQTAEPDVTDNRLQTLLQNRSFSERFHRAEKLQQEGLIKIIGISRFLYHFLCRHPDSMNLIGRPYALAPCYATDVDSLRLCKYRALLQITWMDVCTSIAYPHVLYCLSHLAQTVLAKLYVFSAKPDVLNNLAIMALGKFGAYELNYSSDLDLICVMQNPSSSAMNDRLQRQCVHCIQNLSRISEENTVDGFFYRIDLNLRPWGRAAPLVFSLDDTESYYEASQELWERIAWLRGRYVAGARHLGNALYSSLVPFVFRRTLRTKDLEGLFQIKKEMLSQREKAGYWNVKLGHGGIRDIEFFVQTLQLLNASRYPVLRVTNTLALISAMRFCHLLSGPEQADLTKSYLFLRRLENRLQMIDEQQTCQLPEDHNKLRKIAVMMGYYHEDETEIYKRFDEDLRHHRDISNYYFERLLNDYHIQI